MLNEQQLYDLRHLDTKLTKVQALMNKNDENYRKYAFLEYNLRLYICNRVLTSFDGTSCDRYNINAVLTGKYGVNPNNPIGDCCIYALEHSSSYKPSLQEINILYALHDIDKKFQLENKPTRKWQYGAGGQLFDLQDDNSRPEAYLSSKNMTFLMRWRLKLTKMS